MRSPPQAYRSHFSALRATFGGVARSGALERGVARRVLATVRPNIIPL
jgi:hypothetical protein